MQIPTNVGSERRATVVKRGQKRLGTLSPRPKVKADKLIAGKLILVLRDPSKFPTTREQRFFYTDNGRNYMEVRHGEEFALYRLEAAPVFYSDGPPHPNSLQLAVRVRKSGGVAEPGPAGVAAGARGQGQAASHDQEV